MWPESNQANTVVDLKPSQSINIRYKLPKKNDQCGDHIRRIRWSLPKIDSCEHLGSSSGRWNRQCTVNLSSGFRKV
jgi:hypothetical protein